MRKILLVISCSYLLLITSCGEYLYFDSAPKNDFEAVKLKLQKWPDFAGVYQLKITGLQIDDQDSMVDHFKSNKYDGYSAPMLKKTTDDTLKYFGSLLFFSNRYLEISEKNGVCHFLSFDCINKNIFTRFFRNSTRIINRKDGDSTSISVFYKNDSIKLKVRFNSKKNKTSIDTTFNFKTWSHGDLMCFSKKGESYFPDSIDLNSNNKNAFDYFTTVQEQLYFVQKDTSKGRTKFNISQFQLGRNSFIIRTLNKNDAILDSLGVKYESDIVHYDESQLHSIFNSSLAVNEVTANRIDGFPLSSDNSSFRLLIMKYWYLFGIGVLTLLILLGYFIYKPIRSKKKTSP